MSRVMYHEYLVSPEIRDVLDRISALFGTRVAIDGIEGEWIHFHIPGWIDKTAAIHLETERVKVFGAGAADFQIYCPQNTPDGSGLWIRSLVDWYGIRRAEGFPGVWFY